MRRDSADGRVLADLRQLPGGVQLRGDLPVPAGRRPQRRALDLRGVPRRAVVDGAGGRRGRRRPGRDARGHGHPLPRRRARLAVDVRAVRRRARRRAPATGDGRHLHRAPGRRAHQAVPVGVQGRGPARRRGAGHRDRAHAGARLVPGGRQHRRPRARAGPRPGAGDLRDPGPPPAGPRAHQRVDRRRRGPADVLGPGALRLRVRLRLRLRRRVTGAAGSVSVAGGRADRAGLGAAFTAVRARLGLVALLLALAALAWWSTADRMAGMDAGPGTDLGALGWFLGVWVVMMAAMMLPSLAPTVALYTTMTRRRGLEAPLLFTAGYLFVWGAAGLGAYALFDLARGLLGADLPWDAGGRWLAAGVLAAAALYELTPLKDACLGRCRNPVGFLL